MSISSVPDGDQSATSGKRKTPETINQSGSGKRLRANTGPSNSQNEAYKPASGGGLRVTIKPVIHSGVQAATSTASSSTLSTPTATPEPTSGSLTRRKPIRFHVPQSLNAAPKGQTEASSPIIDTASLARKFGPYPSIAGHFLEVQNGKCLKKEYRLAQRCTNCINKQTGSICLFQASRTFVVPNPPFNHIDSSTPTFFATYRPRAPAWNIRTIFNRDLKTEERDRISGALSFSLRRSLSQAEAHAKLPKCILRPNDENEARKCFYCQGPLFISYWLCGGCGRDYCHACYEAVKDCLPSEGEQLVATDPQSALQAAKNASESEGDISSVSQASGTTFDEQSGIERRYQHDLERLPASVQVNKESRLDGLTQKLLTCGKRRLHGEDHFIPVTTYFAEELTCLLEECEHRQSNRKQLSSLANTTSTTSSETPLDHPVHATCDTVERWDDQKPMVIAGIGEKLEIDWRPENFCKAFARISCQTQDSSSLRKRDMLVTDFFQYYGSARKRDGIWTIDNWPQSSDLASWQPDLYEDFVRCLPLPDYTRPDGVRNLASMVPLNIRNFEMGPKIFCSYKSKDVSQIGSVRLRTSAVDTLNLLAYASENDGQPGEVLWSIWPSSSIHILREYCYEFLAKVNSTTKRPITAEEMKRSTDDPVYFQVVAYLGPEARDELERRGARPWIIRQKAGEAVTVPAGCPFQVCCNADTISININFLSPESLERCLGYSSEFQRDTLTETWKLELFRLNTIAYHALRAYTPNLTTIYDLAEKLQASRPSTQARHQAVIASSVVRPGDKVPKKRGRPPLHASKKAEVARSRSPASYLGVTYEQPPTSDIRGSSAETPAPSPPTSVSTTQSNSKATPSVEKTLGRPVIPPETAASQMVMSVMNAAAASAEVDDIQMDPDSPVISRRPLPKLRGRSPSDIEPVLKPLANSTIRTRPASSLPEDQKAFALQSQNFMATADLSVSVGSRAERSPALQQPSVQQPPMQQPTVQRHIVPQPALQQSTKESARDPAAPQSHTHTPIQIQVGLPASQGVPLPEQAASPVRLGGPAASHRAHVLGNSSPNVISPASQLPTSGAQGQAQKPPVQATTSTEQVPQMRQQTGASLVPAHQLQTIGPLDRVLLDEIVADTKAGLGLIYEITPSDEDHLQVILHDVLRCCQALQNSPSPERDLEVYPEPVQERLKVVLAGLLVLNQTTDSDSNNLRKSRTSAVVLACKKAIATVFTCHRTREAASRAAAVRAGGTAGQPTNVSHRPSSDQSRPAQLAFQRPAQPAQTNGAPAPSSLSANRLPVKETGRVLAFPQGPQSISPINAKPQHPAEISQLQNAGARVTVHDSSGRPVTAAHLSSVPPQHYTRTGSTSTSQATAASPPVPTVSVPANASQQNQISPITSSRPQSERSHITRSNVARFRRFVQVAVDIPFTTSSPPPPPPATGPPLSMMEQLAFDYARFG